MDKKERERGKRSARVRHLNSVAKFNLHPWFRSRKSASRNKFFFVFGNVFSRVFRWTRNGSLTRAQCRRPTVKTDRGDSQFHPFSITSTRPLVDLSPQTSKRQASSFTSVGMYGAPCGRTRLAAVRTKHHKLL